MSSATTDESALTSGTQSTSQASTTSTIAHGLNSLSLTETNSNISALQYTTWVRVLEDVDDWDQSIVDELGLPMLKLCTGNILKVERRFDRTDYWAGSNGDEMGLFPMDTRIAPVLYSKVISLCDKTIDLEGDEIPFQAGQVMDVVTVRSNWLVWASYDGTSPWGETKRYSGIVPFKFVEPIPSEGMTDNPRPEFDPDAMDKYPKWEDVPEFNVRALWNYRGLGERELDLTANEIIVVTKVWGDTWYYGTKGDRSGSFSAGYVSKDLSKPAIASVRPPFHRYYVRAEYDYKATGLNQMNLVLNEIIEVVWINSDGWWEGRSRDGKRRGLFPSNYVRKMVDARAAKQYK